MNRKAALILPVIPQTYNSVKHNRHHKISNSFCIYPILTKNHLHNSIEDNLPFSSKKLLKKKTTAGHILDEDNSNSKSFSTQKHINYKNHYCSVEKDKRFTIRNLLIKKKTK